MATIDLEVEGMNCGSCVKHVTQALQPLAGVTDVAVDLQSGRVRVSGELADGSAPLVSALTAVGYPAKPFKPGVPSIKPNESRSGGCCGGA